MTVRLAVDNWHMSEPDYEWVREQLSKFIADARPRNLSGDGFITARSGPSVPEGQILAQLETIEPILDRLYSEWRETMPRTSNYRFNQQYEGAQRCLARLKRSAEVKEKLGGSTAAQLGGDELHAWVWGAAAPQWESGHFAAAVSAAASNLNSRLQQKTGRTDISNTALAMQAFTVDAAKAGAPRLRLAEPTDSETYKSMQEGAKFFTAGVFLAIRNVLAHLPHDDVRATLTRQEALERLAAMSLAARWIETSDLEVADSS